jgi:glucose-1-phosphate cytidylyltransferase
MKVVLFCGGLGTRLREYSETIPKPLATIGLRPIIWHLMKYYAHHGHKEFILCLGYRGDLIKDYFLNYQETVTNNFVLTHSGKNIELLNSDIDDWKITFIDTGIHSNIGQRLKAVQPWLEGEDYFLANYSDGLSDLDINQVVEDVKATEAIASFMSVRPSQSFHAVEADKEGLVQKIEDVAGAEYWINGGSIKDVFSTIKYGVPEKGMIAWGSQLRPAEMQSVSSYILSLVGTNPANAKDPQGEKYVPEAQ